jgi:hypothetical protein
MNTPKHCEACGSEAAVTTNTIVWQVCCSNGDCPEPESLIGITDVDKEQAIQNWNTVVCPSVRNKYEEAYAKDIETVKSQE